MISLVRHAALTLQFGFLNVFLQPGVSLSDLFVRYGSEEQCAAALRVMRWPVRFHCPRCDCMEHYGVGPGARRLLQCQARRHHTSLTAGTVLDSIRLSLRTWFLAIDLISQDTTGLSSLALMRHLGTSCRNAWLLHHKLMAAMAERDAPEPLAGNEQLDDACIGGERPGVVGRGSPNKVPIVAAVSASDAGHTMQVELSEVGSFTRVAIASWAKPNLLRGCPVRSDRLNCLADDIDAGGAHLYIVVVQRRPRDLPQCTWVNTILGNLKTMIGGGCKMFKFNRCASHCLGAFACRFNHLANLRALLQCLNDYAASSPTTRGR